MTGQLIWLASYPKSGNTWVRALLANYLRDSQTPADINTLGAGPIASDRRLFDEMVGIEASELPDAEVAALRPEVYRRFARELTRTVFVKVHDAFNVIGGEATFPPDAGDRAIYVVRNPLDVAVSLAHHLGTTYDDAVDRMCRGFSFSPGGDRLDEQLPQVLRSWSDHVASWVDASAMQVQVLRYEDLAADAATRFGMVLEFAGLPIDPHRLRRSLSFSTFDELRSQEQARGFRERPRGVPAFFRTGRAGAWREALDESQVARIVDCHTATMSRLGYLDLAGKPSDPP